MRSRTITTPINEKRMLTNYEAAQYIGLGTRTARIYLDKIGATVKFGGRVLFDRNVIDAALDQAHSEQK